MHWSDWNVLRTNLGSDVVACTFFQSSGCITKDVYIYIYMMGSSIRKSYTDNHIKLSLDQTTQATEYTAESSVATKIARYF